MNTFPHCQSVKIIKNGKTWFGKQRYKCHSCKRQAVERKAVTLQLEVLLKRLLLERFLPAIARVLGVSLGWLIPRVKQQWQQVPKQLPIGQLQEAALDLYFLEAHEMWSFVGAKDCQVWLWLAEERRTGLIAGFPIGERNEESALGFSCRSVMDLLKPDIFSENTFTIS